MTKKIIYIAANDSISSKKERANVICDGKNDAQIINEAIQSFTQKGGLVFLFAGTYIILKVKDTHGGIIIDKSNVTVMGEGDATKLLLQKYQDCNAIQIKGVKNVRINNLFIDGNREYQGVKNGEIKDEIEEDDSHFRSFSFNLSGIKADKYSGDHHFPQNVIVSNCTIQNCKALCVMLRGKNMIVENNHLGEARADVVEILNGPGIIRGNIVVISSKTLRTHTALSTDLANFVSITDNKVYVKEGATLHLGFRTWHHSFFHSIKRNVLIVEKNAHVNAVVDSRGLFTSIEDNSFVNYNIEPVLLSINGLNNVSGNSLTNIKIGIRNSHPEYSEKWKQMWRCGFLEDMMVRIKKNFFYNSNIDKGSHKNKIVEGENVWLNVK